MVVIRRGAVALTAGTRRCALASTLGGSVSEESPRAGRDSYDTRRGIPPTPGRRGVSREDARCCACRLPRDALSALTRRGAACHTAFRHRAHQPARHVPGGRHARLQQPVRVSCPLSLLYRPNGQEACRPHVISSTHCSAHCSAHGFANQMDSFNFDQSS